MFPFMHPCVCLCVYVCKMDDHDATTMQIQAQCNKAQRQRPPLSVVFSHDKRILKKRKKKNYTETPNIAHLEHTDHTGADDEDKHTGNHHTH